MKCLVTGGAGYIGSHVVLRLIEEGHEVDIIDNLSTGSESAIDCLKTLGWLGKFVKSDVGDIPGRRVAVGKVRHAGGFGSFIISLYPS